MKRRGIGQVAIAGFVGVTQAAISRWCAGLDVPSDVNLTRLAEGLGVEPGFLRTYDPEGIALLTKAIRPGEFHAEMDAPSLRQKKINAWRAQPLSTSRRRASGRPRKSVRWRAFRRKRIAVPSRKL